METLPAATVADDREALLHFGFLLPEPLGREGECVNHRAFAYQIPFVTPAIHFTVLTTTHQRRALVSTRSTISRYGTTAAGIINIYIKEREKKYPRVKYLPRILFALPVLFRSRFVHNEESDSRLQSIANNPWGEKQLNFGINLNEFLGFLYLK